MSEIEAYRLSSRWADRWGRLWQAEWPGCEYACRAWTKRGVFRKARRWQMHDTDLKMASSRRGHPVQRSQP